MADETDAPNTDTLSTDDLESALEKRRLAKKKRRENVKKHGVGVSALLIAAFGAYESHTNKEVAQLAATIAAEAKVDGLDDRSELVKELNAVKSTNAVLQAKLDADHKLNEERYSRMTDWLKSLSGRHGAVPAVAAMEIPEPEPEPAPAPVEKISKARPARGGDYQDQVQQVLKDKGL